MDEREVLARRMYETWSREGPSAAAHRHFAPDVVWQDPPETPDGDTYRGRDQIVELWKEREPILGALEVELEDATAAGDELLTSVRVRSRSERGFEMDYRHFHLLTFRDGLLARIRVFGSRETAAAAAGQREPAAGETGG